MGSASFPTLLPLAKVEAIGFPFHGLVTDGKLKLPDDTEMTYLSGSAKWSGQAIAVQGNVRRALAELETDSNDNHVWQDYALLSGSDRYLGGVPVNGDGGNFWLYCDAAHPWRIKLETTGNALSTTVKVYLVSVFGIFRIPGAAPTMTQRLLAEYTFTALKYTGASATSGYTNALRLSHSIDGSKTLVNVYAAGGGHWTKSSVFFTEPACLASPITRIDGLHDVLLIELTGEGSISAGSVGAGIAATITHYKTAPGLLIEDTGPLSNPSATEYYVAFALQNDGSVVGAKYRSEAETTVNVISEFPDIYEATGTDTATATIDFAGKMVTISGEMVTHTLGAATTFVSGFIGDAMMSAADPAEFDALLLSVTISSVCSTSIDSLRLTVGGDVNNAVDSNVLVVGKGGHDEVVDPDSLVNWSYHPVTGEFATADFYTGKAICWV